MTWADFLSELRRACIGVASRLHRSCVAPASELRRALSELRRALSELRRPPPLQVIDFI